MPDIRQHHQSLGGSKRTVDLRLAFVNSKKSWFAVARVNGRQVRHTIGNYPTITLGEAREAARLILKDIQLGIYAPVKSETLKPTLDQMIKQFIAIYAKPKNRGWKAVEATFRKFDSIGETARPVHSPLAVLLVYPRRS